MKIKSAFLALFSITLLIYPTLNITLKANSEALTTYDMCFTSERAGTSTERANLKQFAKRGKL